MLPPSSAGAAATAPSARRPASLSLVNLLAKAVGSAGDPYVEARAGRIWTHALQPTIETAHPDARGQLRLEFVDIGAGTGALTAALCQEVLDMAATAGFSPRFRLWFVDFQPVAPAQAFRSAPLRNHLERGTLTIGRDGRSSQGEGRGFGRTAAVWASPVSCSRFRSTSPRAPETARSDALPPFGPSSRRLPRGEKR